MCSRHFWSLVRRGLLFRNHSINATSGRTAVELLARGPDLNGVTLSPASLIVAGQNGGATASGFHRVCGECHQHGCRKRFGKRQQMRWSKGGAHLMLQIRTRTLTAHCEGSSSGGTRTWETVASQSGKNSLLPDCPRLFGTPPLGDFHHCRYYRHQPIAVTTIGTSWDPLLSVMSTILTVVSVMVSLISTGLGEWCPLLAGRKYRVYAATSVEDSSRSTQTSSPAVLATSTTTDKIISPLLIRFAEYSPLVSKSRGQPLLTHCSNT